MDTSCAPVVVKEAQRQLLLRKLEVLALSPHRSSEPRDALAACFERLEAELALGEAIEVYAALKDQSEASGARAPPTPVAPGRSAYRPRACR